MSALDHRTGRHRDRGTVEPVGTASGHGHGHAPPSSRRVKMLLVAVLVPVALATLVGLWLTWPGAQPHSGVDI
ncbi:MAG: hypothetical protein ACRDQJ_07905, partial [Pseudonocardiaceae bacterium]